MRLMRSWTHVGYRGNSEMAAVNVESDLPEWWSARNNKQAERLLKGVNRAKPVGTPPLPLTHIGGGDHPRPQGLFVKFLFPPFVWPEDSETHLFADSDTLMDESKSFEDNAMDVQQAANGVLNGGSWVGESADGAYEAYKEAAAIKFHQADISKAASGLFKSAGADVASTKKRMFEENKQAHQEAETFLRSGSGQSLAQVAVILGVHRTMIQEYSSELQGFSTQYTTQFTNRFMQSPGGGLKVKAAKNGPKPDHSTDDGTQSPAGVPDPALTSAGDGGGPRPAASTPGPGSPGPTTLGGPRPAQSTDGVTPSRHNPLTSLGSGLPSLPSLPGGGSGGGLPFSGLQGLMGGFGGFPGGGMPGAGGFASPATPPASLPSLGMDFGRGLAAGATAAGAVPSVPQAPVTPLTAPVESAPVAAAPAAAPVSAPAPTGAAPAPSPGVPAGEGMTPYGSVLPPQAPPSTPSAGSTGAAPSTPTEGSSGGGSSAPGGGAGLMPVAGRREGASVRRELAWSDLESAKMAVAELAEAASVTDPGLDWAVAVGRNASGMPTYWVATNDGAAYIPPGVFLRKTMPVAGGHSEEFDARWFGWVNPADKAVRAARDCGDTVSAVATSWALPSEFLSEHPRVPEVALGVKPTFERDNAATALSSARAHRLQTVDAALHADLTAAGESVLRDYCRVLTRQLVFGVAGEELSSVAQSVGRALVGERWPSAQEWALLSEEYEDALVLMGAQRPGLNGVEYPDQTVSYTREFIRCRQLEALLCWERHSGDLLNVVYAAWVAGIRAPLKGAVLQ